MTPTRPRTVREGRGLAEFAAMVVAFMVLVIVEGAIVRATGSGNGCGSHWPLCNNQIIPHHPRLATIIEFTHRSLTGVCTALVAGLIFWTFLATNAGNPARKASVLTGILLLTEGALGAVLVLGGYVERNASTMRVFVQAVHFTNTMLLLAAMTVTWRLLLPAPATPDRIETHRGLLWSTLLATLITGAAGSVAALADTIFPAASLRAGLASDFDPAAPLLIHMRWVHPAAACFSMVLAGVLALRAGSTKTARLLWTLIAAQFLLGIADVLLLTPVALQALHLLVADAFWITLISLSTKILWPAAAQIRQAQPSTKSSAFADSAV